MADAPGYHRPNLLAVFMTMPVGHGDNDESVPKSNDEPVATPLDNHARAKVPRDLEGVAAEELEQSQKFVAEVRADEERVRPLPNWLTQGPTDDVKASYKPPTFWRATILEVQTDSGTAFYGGFDSYSIRSKPFSSAMLPMLVSTLDAAKASQGNDIMLDPDECSNVTFELLGAEDPASTAVRKFSSEMESKLAALRFIGKPAPRDPASKVHPLYEVITEAASDGRPCTFWWRSDPNRVTDDHAWAEWLKARHLARGTPCSTWWYSRAARYHTIANDAFYEFRQKDRVSSRSRLPAPAER